MTVTNKYRTMQNAYIYCFKCQQLRNAIFVTGIGLNNCTTPVTEGDVAGVKLI